MSSTFQPGSRKPTSGLAQQAELVDLLIERATDFAIFMLDSQGKVVTWSEGARRILGYEEHEILGQSHAVFYTDEDIEQGVPARCLREATERGKTENERWMIRKDRSLFYASGIDYALLDRGQHAGGFSTIFRDRTTQKQTEDLLRTTEERYRQLIESVTEYAIFTLDADGHIMDWNTGAERVLGYRADEVIGQSSAILFTPEDVAAGEPLAECERAERDGRAEDERWHVKRGGIRFWASGVLMPMRTTQQRRFIKVMRDMTAKKQAEVERGRQQAQIAVLQERNRMAQEIHDTLAQGFTGITIQLEAARALLATSPDQADAHIARAAGIARESLNEARRSVQALRPALLQTQPLVSVIPHLIEQATAGTHITGEFHLQGSPRPLRPAIEDDILRVVQEALTNALRHSQATRVWVDFAFQTEKVQLTVRDNGHGYDIHKPIAGGHFGLMGMRERAERHGGQLKVRSEPGMGTEISLVVPDSGTLLPE